MQASGPHDGGWISLVRFPAVDYLQSLRTRRSGGHEHGRPSVAQRVVLSRVAGARARSRALGVREAGPAGAPKPRHLPVVLTREEVCAVLQRLDGVPRLMALLLYGAGLRRLECCRLRVKDVDFATNQIVIRDGKGHKDRVTMLPAAVKAALTAHLQGAHEQHQADLRHGAGWVELPGALLRKYTTPAANGAGNGSSPPRVFTWSPSPARDAGTTSTNPCFSER